jgi:hypothetical protein
MIYTYPCQWIWNHLIFKMLVLCTPKCIVYIYQSLIFFQTVNLKYQYFILSKLSYECDQNTYIYYIKALTPHMKLPISSWRTDASCRWLFSMSRKHICNYKSISLSVLLILFHIYFIFL